MPLLASYLPDRGVLHLEGSDAPGFLNGLVTADVHALADGSARFAALLTPQGKIIVDFFVIGSESGLIIEAPRALILDLINRLKIYRLRAKIEITDLSERFDVVALWGADAVPDTLDAYADPRLAAMGFRALLPKGDDNTLREAGVPLCEADTYHAHRIGLHVPQGGLDFTYGDTFPHDADMDALNGVDFKKGCYVGQEVVSRMQHRGLARKRIVPVAIDGAHPYEGVDITANGQIIGHMGTSAKSVGLAMLRLDKLEEALNAGATILAGGVPVRAYKPDWAGFIVPGSDITGAA